MKNRNIKLKKENNKKGKIIRRFIHSFDRNENLENNNYINVSIGSDTELYIEANKKNNIDMEKNKNSKNVINKKDNQVNVNVRLKSLESDELSSITLEENTKSKEKS